MRAGEEILPAEGPGAPPRANGELVFSAPWESRIFGITMALHEAGRFEWSEFQARLIEAIARHESERRGEGYDYWASWLEAFRALAEAKRWTRPADLERTERELASRPPAHDH